MRRTFKSNIRNGSRFRIFANVTVIFSLEIQKEEKWDLFINHPQAAAGFGAIKTLRFVHTIIGARYIFIVFRLQ